MDSTLLQRAKDTDLLAMAQRYTTLKRAASSGGGEYAGPCPICGGRDRFHVQPESGRWLCRHCTEGKWNDAIALHMRLAGCTFPQAVEALAGTTALPSAPARRVAAPVRDEDAGAPPSAQWQGRAVAVIERAQEHLWGEAGSVPLDWETSQGIKHLSARDYLAWRGFTEDTIRTARLGFIPDTVWDKAKHWGLIDKDIYLARGILIPCQVHGVVWYLKIRQPIGYPKYIQARGGQAALYGAESLAGHDAAVFCEGEFDTLLLWQQAGDLAGVVTLGSASNRLDVGTWGLYILPVKRRLLAYDLDPAGVQGAAALGWLGGAQRLTVPQLGEGDNDLTDYHKAGGDLRAWLEEALDPTHNAKRGPSEAFSGELGHRCPTRKRWEAWQANPADRELLSYFVNGAILDGWPFYDDTGVDLGVDGWMNLEKVAAQMEAA